MENRPNITKQSEIQEIFSLCIQIQNAGIATAFFEMQAHVAAIAVSIYLPKWEREKKWDKRFECWLNHEYADRILLSIKEELEQILKQEPVTA